jgi:hypothetical protein
MHFTVYYVFYSLIFPPTCCDRYCGHLQGGYTLVTLPRIVTPYRDSVDGTRARVTYQKLVTR